MTFATKIITFNKSLAHKTIAGLATSITVMNPYQDPYVLKVSSAFYNQYFDDTRKRKLILGINPGKSGAGVTGVPFTDTENLKECGISWAKEKSYEPSSRFIYDLIEEYNKGSTKFYQDFFISNVCPLGFTKRSDKGRTVNINYYDMIELLTSTTPFILESLKAQIGFGIDTSKVFCLGTTENYQYLKNLNKEHRLFDEIVALTHPRYIIQYKNNDKKRYIDRYLKALGC
ncbi:uracil-DNA glycosylase family protein [Aquimarina gracilis]|uniref:Uracil-DNA glycosylase family protein n=1 Tax=Aquimarina gracilis TaxID=874422 RepID=A0ABU5ZWX6_9FLAO|nr:uracil-DNA glycosylase family protein [Aquimarina gracilis]MEB3346366.1 uracil-DNA glycosylase family protein [Aquimarina gracilis]